MACFPGPVDSTRISCTRQLKKRESSCSEDFKVRLDVSLGFMFFAKVLDNSAAEVRFYAGFIKWNAFLHGALSELPGGLTGQSFESIVESRLRVESCFEAYGQQTVVLKF